MRKKILILVHSPSIPFIDSSNQYVKLFDKSQYEVTVAYLVEKDTDEVRQKTLGDHVVFFDFSRANIRGLKILAIRKLLTFCRQNQFEMVICHRYKPIYLMLWVAQFLAIPKLLLVMHAIGTLQNNLRKLLIACLFKENMYFAGVSDAVRDDLRKNLWLVPSEKVVTLHNTIDHEYFAPQLLSRESARDKLTIDNNTIVFGHVGRLEKEKDHKNLINAFSLLQRQSSNSKLVIIGDGKLEAELKEQVHDLGLDNHVIFTGFLSDGFRYMKAFDALILCSIKEAFGRVLLEAMLAHVPIIATKIYGIPEVVGDSGFLVKPNSPEELASAMLTVAQLPEMQRTALVEKSYQRMLDCFSTNTFKKTFWQIFA